MGKAACVAIQRPNIYSFVLFSNQNMLDQLGQAGREENNIFSSVHKIYILKTNKFQESLIYRFARVIIWPSNEGLLSNISHEWETISDGKYITTKLSDLRYFTCPKFGPKA